ncbi:MAG: hypothetical protein ACWGNB_01110 [Thiogranum sp.]
MKLAYLENRVLLPWESYHRAVADAKLARGRLLRDLFSGAWLQLRQHICCSARRWSEQCCHQCC